MIYWDSLAFRLIRSALTMVCSPFVVRIVA